MKVILQQNVQKVGKKYEVVDVAQGYAEHSLFPKKLAILANEKNLAQLKRHQMSVANEQALRHKLLDEAINTVRDLAVTMAVKANDQGNLFSKIDTVDIAAYLVDTYRISLDPKLMTVQNGPIKKVGQYHIDITDDGYHSTFTITIVQQ
jgi:large subunit ribosomal protein L9